MMLSSYNLHISEDLFSLHISLLIIECFLILLGAIIFGIFLNIFCVHPQFHPHLIVIFCNFYLSYFVATAARIVILGNYFFTGCTGFELTYKWTQYCDGLRVVGGIAAVMTCPTLMIERIIASSMLIRYENYRNYPIPLLVLFSQWAFAIFVVSMIIANDIDIAFFVPFGQVAIFFSGIATYRLKRWTSVQYKQYLRFYTLSERFQLSENIRFLKLLLPSCVTFLVFAFCISLIFILAEKVPSFHHSNTIMFILYHSYESLIALLTSSIPPVCIYSSDIWRKEFKRILSMQKCRSRKTASVLPHQTGLFIQSPSPRILSLNGGSLLIDLNRQGEHYFMSLQSTWQVNVRVQ